MEIQVSLDVTWQHTFIKQKKLESKDINSLKSNRSILTKAVDKANILNQQFKSAFTKLVLLKLKHLAELQWPCSISSPLMPGISIQVSGFEINSSK